MSDLWNSDKIWHIVPSSDRVLQVGESIIWLLWFLIQLKICFLLIGLQNCESVPKVMWQYFKMSNWLIKYYNTETRDFVRSSKTPAFSRYFRNSSFFASWVILDMLAAEGFCCSERRAHINKLELLYIRPNAHEAFS